MHRLRQSSAAGTMAVVSVSSDDASCPMEHHNLFGHDIAISLLTVRCAATFLLLVAGAVKAALQMPSKTQGIVNCW